MMLMQSALSKAMTAMLLAWTVAEARSKDPKTKVGACLITRDGREFLGYNGFPAGVPDSVEAWHEMRGAEFTKHDMVVHAEANAMRKAMRAGADLAGSTLAVTHFPCVECLKLWVLGTGVETLIYTEDGPVGPQEIGRWRLTLSHLGVQVFKASIEDMWCVTRAILRKLT